MMQTADLILDALPNENIGELTATLHEAQLPHNDLAGTDKRFFCASVDGTIVGYVGLEIYRKDALLRSAVIFKPARSKGYGRQMVEALLDIAFQVGVERVWLLTETAPEFFEKLGFSRVDRALAPSSIVASEEFASMCPTSAVFMLRAL
jgi:N-acetylglutamate synthase-like GNAT family acetyltransferase